MARELPCYFALRFGSLIPAAKRAKPSLRLLRNLASATPRTRLASISALSASNASRFAASCMVLHSAKLRPSVNHRDPSLRPKCATNRSCSSRRFGFVLNPNSCYCCGAAEAAAPCLLSDRQVDASQSRTLDTMADGRNGSSHFRSPPRSYVAP